MTFGLLEYTVFITGTELSRGIVYNGIPRLIKLPFTQEFSEINKSMDASTMPFAVLEFPDVPGSIGICEGTFTIPFAVLEFPDVLASVDPYVGALAIEPVVLVFADVLISIGICDGAMSM